QHPEPLACSIRLPFVPALAQSAELQTPPAFAFVCGPRCAGRGSDTAFATRRSGVVEWHAHEARGCSRERKAQREAIAPHVRVDPIALPRRRKRDATAAAPQRRRARRATPCAR